MRLQPLQHVVAQFRIIALLGIVFVITILFMLLGVAVPALGGSK